MPKYLCELCLEECENAIHITSSEGSLLNVSSILHKHFQCCFDVCLKFYFLSNLIYTLILNFVTHTHTQKEPDKGSVCLTCWTKVKNFHEFYLIVEELHNSIREQASVFVEVINDDTIIKKEQLDENDDIDNDNAVKYNNDIIDHYKVGNNFSLGIGNLL